MKRLRIHATPYSAGGIIIAGILLVIGTLTWIAWNDPDRSSIQVAVFFILFASAAAYYFDAASESLSLENGMLTFDSIFRPKRRINVCAMSDVSLIHQGLNQERGIVSAIFRGPGGQGERLPLGPMWRQTQLSAFFSSLEGATGECRLVGEVR
jgi:hypothetical protein